MAPNKIKHTILIILAVSLFLPLFQLKFPFYEVKPLKGAVVKAEKPIFSWKLWMDETYAPAYEKYLNQAFGFRNWLVRLNNQIDFTLFHKSNAKGVIIGKENYLFEENYIRAFYGTNFIGDSLINVRVQNLKLIREYLQSKGKDLLVVLAAGKGTFYSEFIPDKYYTKPGITNNEVYVKTLTQAGIPFIDFNSYFLKAKDTSRYLLYPQTGIHWSQYGMILVADSIARFIGNTLHEKLPEIRTESIELTNRFQGSDGDIEEGMNLICQINKQTLIYPKFNYFKEERVQPKVLVIADSYYWGLFNMGVSTNMFDNGRFWFYNNEVFPDNYQKSTKVSDLNILEEIQKQDIVILMATEATLDRFPWGFDIMAINAFHNTNTKNQQAIQRIKEIADYIRKTQEWIAKIEIKAKDRNISVDSMIRIDARYLYREEQKKLVK
ncbi:MAG: hypothetical protein Q7J34_02795 [Bacteroidales bacterium]|nr:hypothetical protein [Bacteroidales bacterium]